MEANRIAVLRGMVSAALERAQERGAGGDLARGPQGLAEKWFIFGLCVAYQSVRDAIDGRNALIELDAEARMAELWRQAPEGRALGGPSNNLRAPGVISALRHWLGPETWHTPHPCDQHRFHEVTWAVWHEIQGVWNEREIMELMTEEAERLHPNFNGDERLRVLEEHISRGTELLEFLSNMRESGKL